MAKIKEVIVYIWNTNNEPFGVFESQFAAEMEIERIADLIKTTPERIKLDLYIYKMPLNTHYEAVL